MKLTTVGAAMLMPGLVAGCGGSSDSSAMAYNFITPQVNSQRTHSRAIDDSNNAINETLTDTLTSVNADGSYVVMEEDPNHNSVTVDGTLYSIPTETLNVNDSGQTTAYSYLAPSGTTVTCTYAAHASGPDFPLMVGQTWTLAFSRTCAAKAPISYAQTASVVDVGRVTVAAGTYSALKLQSTLTWTDLNGTTRTRSITNWRDVATTFSVKESVSTAYSGTVPSNGYAVTSETELQSGP